MSHSAVPSFAKDADALLVQLRRIRDGQIGSQPFRQAAQQVVRNYFSTVRPSIELQGDSVLVSALDAGYQDLMRYANGRTTKSRYLKLLKSLVTTGRELEIALLSNTFSASSHDVRGERDRLIIETLERLVPTAARSFEQGLMDLRSGNRVSWRGSVVEFREALREALDHLAPDADVESQHGFKRERDTHGPTMKQKVVFILKSRKKSSNETKSSTDAVDVVDETVGNFVRSVYQRSSTATHLALGKDETNRVREFVTLSLMEILEINHQAS